jgi:AraC family transcriptional activator of mtrCDE
MRPDAEIFCAILPLLQVTPEIQKNCNFSDFWRSEHGHEQPGWASFHIITKGQCILQMVDGTSVELAEGDVAVLTAGQAHMLSSTVDDDAATVPEEIISRTIDGVQINSNCTHDPETRLVCGRLRFGPEVRALVPILLPSAIIFSSANGPDAAHARVLVDLIQQEFDIDRVGSSVIAAALASVLMAITIRAYLETGDKKAGFLRLISNPRTARVISAVLQNPSQDWTLQELADQAHMSRATLARNFRRALGTAPLAFLAELRLSNARRSVLNSAKSLAVIAHEAGYQSDASFSRAYRRRFGVAPGADRRKVEQPSLAQNDTLVQ